jgi:hypothetical protein
MILMSLDKNLPVEDTIHTSQFYYISKATILDVQNRLERDYHMKLFHAEMPPDSRFGDHAPGQH